MTKKEAYLQEIEAVITQGPYQAEWESLCKHRTPHWYQNDKFGIFIHWGIYSVPAFRSEWYARELYKEGSLEYNHHVDKYGTLDQFGYKDFIPMFQAEHFCAQEWAELFKRSGARYVMPVAEHHDGFQMYESELSKWNAAQMGPCRDVLGELKEAVEAEGLKICASSHRAENWWFFDAGRSIPEADVNDPRYEGLYGSADGFSYNNNDLYDNPPDQEFLEDWLVRTCEIIDKYQPNLLYFDCWIEQYAFKPYLKKLGAYYYNRAVQWGTEVAINAKLDAFVYGSAVMDIEKGQLGSINHAFWQKDTSAAKSSWGYITDNSYKKSQDIVCDLVDVVSKNGAFLLNIGPKADGTIPEEDRRILLDIGDWLAVNGEAVYDTTCWKIFGEGPTVVPEGAFKETLSSNFTPQDIRFTCRANIIYAIVLKWPEDGNIRIKSLGNHYRYLKSTVKQVEILGCTTVPRFGFYKDLVVNASFVQAGDMPVVLKITVR